jgi:hypothetical protein
MPVKIDRGSGDRHADPLIQTEERTMKVKMLITKSGSPDGLRLGEYQARQTYDLPPRLAMIFLKAGWAQEVKDLGRSPETKAAPPTAAKKPARTTRKKR